MGMEGRALGARPFPAAAACQSALHGACPHAVHGMEPMRGGGLENPPSFSWRTAVEGGFKARKWPSYQSLRKYVRC